MAHQTRPPVPPTHPAVVTTAARAPLELLEVPKVEPQANEVVVHVQWTSSSPLELHQADSGLLVVAHPYVMGGCYGGTVAQIGTTSSSRPDKSGIDLHVGDAVFGFAFQTSHQRGHQTYVTVPTFLVSKLPPSLTLAQAVTVPTNLVTAFHASTKDLGLEFPYPLPDGWSPPGKLGEARILVWGAASSVGLYALQVYRHWGYRNVIAVASRKHHSDLQRFGALQCFDYHDEAVTDKILEYVSQSKRPPAEYILDCIGSLAGTLEPISKIAEAGAKVAVMLPVIVKDATASSEPEYEMDVSKCLVGQWKEGVEVLGVRTHSYCDNKFLKEHLQNDIIPSLLETGVVEPNPIKLVEGRNLLERAQKALGLLRERAPSGQKLVWRVADDIE